MKLEYRLFVIGLLTIGIFDALGSIGSKQLNFNSAYLAPGSFIIYCIFGFVGTKRINLKTGVLIAAAIGLFDSTVGWEISKILGANTGNIKNDPILIVWIITIIFVTGLAAICGLIGGGIAKAFYKK
jgi:hypothetical protein